MAKDLNKTDQSVAGTEDLNNAQVVTEPDLTASGQGDKPEKLADGTDENKTVPYTELKKAIDGKKAAEEQATEAAAQTQLLQNQMAVMAANQNQPVQQVQQPLSDYDQAKTDLGLADEAYMAEDQRSKVYARMTEIMNARSQQVAAGLANQQFESSHPDFGSVVGLRNPLTGQIQPTAEISTILTKKPHLTAAAYASSEGAYKIVIEQREIDKLQQQNTVTEEHLKQQEIDTKLAPVSGAAAAGGAVTATGAAVTVEQQQAMEERVASGEFNQKG